jgi:hypothetical protein
MVRTRFSHDPSFTPVLGDKGWFPKTVRVLYLARSIRQQNNPESRINQSDVFRGFQRYVVGPVLRTQLLRPKLLEDIFR